MTIYQAMILVNDMAKSNNENVDFAGGNPLLDNIAGDCLRLHKARGGYEVVIRNWTGWQGLTLMQIRLVWKMAEVLLANCSVEMD